MGSGANLYANYAQDTKTSRPLSNAYPYLRLQLSRLTSLVPAEDGFELERGTRMRTCDAILVPPHWKDRRPARKKS